MTTHTLPQWWGVTLWRTCAGMCLCSMTKYVCTCVNVSHVNSPAGRCLSEHTRSHHPEASGETLFRCSDHRFLLSTPPPTHIHTRLPSFLSVSPSPSLHPPVLCSSISHHPYYRWPPSPRSPLAPALATQTGGLPLCFLENHLPLSEWLAQSRNACCLAYLVIVSQKLTSST